MELEWKLNQGHALSMAYQNTTWDHVTSYTYKNVLQLKKLTFLTKNTSECACTISYTYMFHKYVKLS